MYTFFSNKANITFVYIDIVFRLETFHYGNNFLTFYDKKKMYVRMKKIS